MGFEKWDEFHSIQREENQLPEAPINDLSKALGDAGRGRGVVLATGK